MRRYSSKGSVRTVALVVALIFLIVAVSYLIGRSITGTWDIRRWFDKPAQTETIDDNLVITPADQSSMCLSVQSDSVIDTQSDNSYTITATVTDATGAALDVLQDVSWSMSWIDEQTSDVCDYVTMTVDGCTATFVNTQPFDTQIVVTCTSNISPSVKASATIDYAKRFVGWFCASPGCITFTHRSPHSSNIGDYELKIPFLGTEEISLFSGVEFGKVGSVDNALLSGTITITPTSEFEAAVNEAAGSQTYDYKSLTWLILPQDVREADGTVFYGSSDPITASELIGYLCGVDPFSSAIGPLLSYVRASVNDPSSYLMFSIDLQFKYGSYHNEFPFSLAYAASVSNVALDTPSIIM